MKSAQVQGRVKTVMKLPKTKVNFQDGSNIPPTKIFSQNSQTKEISTLSYQQSDGKRNQTPLSGTKIIDFQLRQDKVKFKKPVIQSIKTEQNCQQKSKIGQTLSIKQNSSVQNIKTNKINGSGPIHKAKIKDLQKVMDFTNDDLNLNGIKKQIPKNPPVVIHANSKNESIRREPFKTNFNNVHDLKISEFSQHENVNVQVIKQQQSDKTPSLKMINQQSSRKAEGKLSLHTYQNSAMEKIPSQQGDDDQIGQMNDHKIDQILKESDKGYNTAAKINLNQTPQPINTIQQLLSLFGQKFDSESNSFNYNGQQYKVNVENLARDLGYVKKKDIIMMSSETNSNFIDMPLVDIGGLCNSHHNQSMSHHNQSTSKKNSDRFKSKLKDDFFRVNKTPGDHLTTIDKGSFLNGGQGMGKFNPMINSTQQKLNSQRNLNPNMQMMPNTIQKISAYPMSTKNQEDLNERQDYTTHNNKNTLDPEILIAKRSTNKSVVVAQSVKSHDQESMRSGGRPKSNQGFTQMQEKHYDGLKMNRMRAESRMKLSQKRRSMDVNKEGLGSDQGDSRKNTFINQANLALNSPSFIQQQPSININGPQNLQVQNQGLQVQHQQTEIQNMNQQNQKFIVIPQISQNNKSQEHLMAFQQMKEKNPNPAMRLNQQQTTLTGSDNVEGAIFQSQNSILKNNFSNLEPYSSPKNIQESIPGAPNQLQQSHSNLNRSQDIHLAFLFASPLMLKTSENIYIDALDPISFEEEFEQIKQSIEVKGIQFNYRYQVATSTNLLKVLRSNPVGLHFSGHGFKNEQRLYKGDNKAWTKYKNKGDVLIFENDYGSSEFFFQEDLEKMIQNVAMQSKRLEQMENQNIEQDQDEPTLQIQEDSGADKVKESATNLQFVLVASCHSEKVGEIFLKIGVRHLICVNQNQTILDKAMVEFSKIFYDEVFDKYSTICDAFQNAKDQVTKIYGSFQANKILLKTFDNHDHSKCIFKDHRQQSKPGTLNRIDDPSLFNFLPAKVSPFLFRNLDMFDVLKLLTENTIVQIFGLPGLGKSSLMKNVCVFLGERNIFKQGLVYIDLSLITTLQESLKIVNMYLNIDEDTDQFQMTFNSEIQQIDYEKQQIKRVLAPMNSFLIALDNIDHLVKDEYTNFLRFIKDLSLKTKVKFLFTSARYEPTLFQEKGAIKKLRRLTLGETADLFIKKIPLTESDKQAYFEFANVKELDELTKKFYKDNNVDLELPKLCGQRHQHQMQGCIVKYLKEHPMFEFFQGTPLVISIMAPFAAIKSLKDICIDLWNKKKVRDADNEDMTDISNAYKNDCFQFESLLDSLDYCTEYFERLSENEDTPILEMWYMIGLNGPGILRRDLQAIFCGGKDQNYFQSKMKLDFEKHKTGVSGKDKLELGGKQDTAERQDRDEVNQFQMFERRLDDLMTFSVIECESVDFMGNYKRLKVGPMINDYITQKMSHSFKEMSMNLVCTHLRDVLIDMKTEYSEQVRECQSEKDLYKYQDELKDKIIRYENQIMHLVNLCIKLEYCKGSHADEYPQQMKNKNDVTKDSFTSDSDMAQDSLEEIEDAKPPILDKVAQSQKMPLNKTENNLLKKQNQIVQQQSENMAKTSKINDVNKNKKKRKTKDVMQVHVSKNYLNQRLTMREDQIKEGLKGLNLQSDPDIADAIDFEMPTDILPLKKRADSEFLKKEKKIVNKLPLPIKLSFKQGTTTAESGDENTNGDAPMLDQADGQDNAGNSDKSLKEERDRSFELMNVPPSSVKNFSNQNTARIQKEQALATILEAAENDPNNADEVGKKDDSSLSLDKQETIQSLKIVSRMESDRPFELNSLNQKELNQLESRQKQINDRAANQKKEEEEEKPYNFNEMASDSDYSQKSAQKEDKPATDKDKKDQAPKKEEVEIMTESLILKEQKRSNFFMDHQNEMEKDEDGYKEVQVQELASTNQFAATAIFQIANELNPHNHVCMHGEDNCLNVDHFKDKDLINRLSVGNQAPDVAQNLQLMKRQKTILKRRDTIKYHVNKNGAFQRVSQKFFEHSFKKKERLPEFMNPDLGIQPQDQDYSSPNRNNYDNVSDNEEEQQQIFDHLLPIKEGQDKNPGANRDRSNSALRQSKTTVADKKHDQFIDYNSQPQQLPVHRQTAKIEHETISKELKSKRQLQIPEERKSMIKLQPYEELFFHYLSILAVIPKESPKVLMILDSFGIRHQSPNDQQKDEQCDQQLNEKKTTFNRMQNEATKKLTSNNTFIEIPDQSKLLKANTLMLELYVEINEAVEELLEYMKIPTHHKFTQKKTGTYNYDLVYENADKYKEIFEEIQFKRGIAIMFYIQAFRKVRKNHKDLKEFKEKIKESARLFEEVHEICGIRQCIDLARQNLKLKAVAEQKQDGQNTEQVNKAYQINKLRSDLIYYEDNQNCIDYLEERLKSLENCEHQNFVQYRLLNKVPNMAAQFKPKPQRKDSSTAGEPSVGNAASPIHVDKVLNMLLNPQCELTLTINLKK